MLLPQHYITCCANLAGSRSAQGFIRAPTRSRRLAMERSGSPISAIFASTAPSPSALSADAFSSLARSVIAALSSSVNPLRALAAPLFLVAFLLATGLRSVSLCRSCGKAACSYHFCPMIRSKVSGRKGSDQNGQRGTLMSTRKKAKTAFRRSSLGDKAAEPSSTGPETRKEAFCSFCIVNEGLVLC